MIAYLCRHKSIILLAIAVMLTTALGCGEQSGVSADQFVGKWELSWDPATMPFPPGPPTLELRADGRGRMADPPNPRDLEIMWVVRRDRLVITQRTGGGRHEFGFRFDSPDELVLIREEGEIAFQRAEPSEETE